MEKEICPKYDEFNIRLNHVESEINELKIAVKDNENFFRDTISVMKENLVELKTITAKIEEKSEKTDLRLDKQDEKLDTAIKEIYALRVDMANSVQQNNQNKFQWFIDIFNSPNMKLYFFIVVGILGLLGFLNFEHVKAILKWIIPVQ